MVASPTADGEEDTEVQINFHLGRLTGGQRLSSYSQQQPGSLPSMPVCRRVEFDADSLGLVASLNELSVREHDRGRISPISCPIEGTAMSLVGDTDTPCDDISVSCSSECPLLFTIQLSCSSIFPAMPDQVINLLLLLDICTFFSSRVPTSMLVLLQ